MAHAAEVDRANTSEQGGPEPVEPVAIGVIDIVGSTRLCRAIGDERFAALMYDFRAFVRGWARSTGAIEFDMRGDGFIHLHRSVDAAIVDTALLLDAEPSRLADVELRAAVHHGPLASHGDTTTGLALHEACALGDAAGTGRLWVSIAARAASTVAGLRGPPKLVEDRKGAIHAVHELAPAQCSLEPVPRSGV